MQAGAEAAAGVVQVLDRYHVGVAARAAVERVRAAAAFERIVARAAFQHVVPVATGDRIGTRAADHKVGRRQPLDGSVGHALIIELQDVVRTVEHDRIGDIATTGKPQMLGLHETGPGERRVAADIAHLEDRQIGIEAVGRQVMRRQHGLEQHVAAVDVEVVGPGDLVVRRSAFEHGGVVLAALADDDVAATLAGDDVVAVAADNDIVETRGHDVVDIEQNGPGVPVAGGRVVGQPIGDVLIDIVRRQRVVEAGVPVGEALGI